MNAFDQQERLPATEALHTSLASQMIPERELRRVKIVTPQSSNESLESAPKRRNKRSFDMADLLTATEPVEQAIAFPAIEWCNDGEEEDEAENAEKDQLVPVVSSLDNNDDEHDEVNDYFPSTFSSTGLGKRSRLGYSRLGRSRSLKTSLCSLAEQSASTVEDECSKPGGSWPKFSLGQSEARDARRQQHKRQKNLKTTQQDLQMNILLPLVS